MLLDVALFLASILPRVEDPWPDTISLEAPFLTAGIGGVFASLLYSERPKGERDEAIHSGGFFGFWVGALFYVVSLLNQLTFSL